jgi:hypothetical protein
LVLHGAYEGSEPRDPLQLGEEVRSDARLPAAHMLAPMNRQPCGAW